MNRINETYLSETLCCTSSIRKRQPRSFSSSSFRVRSYRGPRKSANSNCSCEARLIRSRALISLSRALCITVECPRVDVLVAGSHGGYIRRDYASFYVGERKQRAALFCCPSCSGALLFSCGELLFSRYLSTVVEENFLAENIRVIEKYNSLMNPVARSL